MMRYDTFIIRTIRVFSGYNRIMRRFQFIKLETARLTNNKRGIV